MIYAPRSFDLDAYVRELPPDLGRVLLKVAVVEEWLEGLLLVHLDLDEAGVAKQFGDYGPLNSFGKKIRKAHELHLIDDEAEANLIVLKEVRNAFAHTRRHLDLTSYAITKWLGEESFDVRVQRAINTLDAKLEQSTYNHAVGNKESPGG